MASKLPNGMALLLALAGLLIYLAAAWQFQGYVTIILNFVKATHRKRYIVGKF